jgi:polysaccharide biosynthesis transport protein
MGLVMGGLQVVSLKPHLDVLYRHRIGAVCAFVVGLGVTAFTLMILPNVFVSSTVVLVQPQTVEAGNVPTTTRPDDVATRVSALTDQALRRARLEEIIHQLDLYPRAQAAGVPIDLMADRMHAHVGIEMNSNDDRDAPRPTSFKLTFEYPDRELVQQATAMMAQTYIDEDLQERSRQADAASQFLGEQVASAQAKVQEKADEIKAYKMRHRGALPEEMENSFRQLDLMQAQLNSLDQSLNSAKQISPQTRLQQLETQLTTLRAQYSDSYPDVRSLRAQIEALKRAPSEAGAQNPASQDAGTNESLITQKQALEGQMERIREQIAETPTREQELAVMNREYDVVTKDYEQLLHKQLDAQVSARLERSPDSAHLKILEPAELPLLPARPNRFAILVFGLVFSAAAALGLPFALFFTDTSFKDPDELGSEYGLPVLVAIPEVEEVAANGEFLWGALRALTASCVTLTVAVAAVWVYATRFF